MAATAAPEIVRLVARIEEFCAQPARASGLELAADMTELRRGVDLIELKFSEMAAAFAATDEYDEQGSVSPVHWIRHHCNMGSGAAADRVAVGAQLISLQESAEAMASGEIGFAHLALIARPQRRWPRPRADSHSTRGGSSARRESSASAVSAISAITRVMPQTPMATQRSRFEVSRAGL